MSGALSSIYNNMGYALSLHAKALTQLQEQVATGSRVNRPSDAPSEAYQVMQLSTQKRYLNNYMKSIHDSMGTLSVSSGNITEMTSIILRQLGQVTAVMSGTNENTRDIIAEGFDSALEQIVSLANHKHLGQYIYSGSSTSTAPYAIQRTDGQITSVTYQGSYEERNVEVAAGVETNAFYIGDNLFRSDNRSAPVFSGTTGAVAGTGTSSVRGDTWLTVEDLGAGNYRFSVDGGATVDSDNLQTNLALTSATGEILYLDTTAVTSAGTELVRVPGTYDVFNTLIGIRDILQNDNGLSDTQLTQAISNLSDSLNEMKSLLSSKQTAVGSKIGFMESLRHSIENMTFDAEDQTSALQDADIAQIAIDISRRDVLYQMSLSMIGRFMSTSLMDFI
ncbi:flagellar hook-associated protein FlgL [Planctomycetota bacterium]